MVTLLRLLFAALSILYLICQPCRAQQKVYDFTQLTTEHGLPANVVNCVYQDRQGFIWGGTQQGLCRYDGHNFKPFFHTASDSFSVAGNRILDICEDNTGQLWVGSGGGLSKYDKRSGKFISMFTKPAKEVSPLLPLDNHHILARVGTPESNAIEVINTHSLQANPVQRLLPPGPRLIADKASIATNRSKDIFLWQHHNDTATAWKFDNKKGRFGKAVFLPYSSKTSSEPMAFFVDSRNRYWLCLENTLLVFDVMSPGDKPKLLYTIKENLGMPRHLYEDDNNTLWISSVAGLAEVNLTNFTIVFHHEKRGPHPIGSNVVNGVVKDSQGLLWIATYNGLNKLNLKKSRFTNITAQNEDGRQLANNAVMGLLSSANADWIRVFYLFGAKQYSAYHPGRNKLVHYPFDKISGIEDILNIGFRNPQQLQRDTAAKYIPLLKKYFRSNALDTYVCMVDDSQRIWINHFNEITLFNTGKTWNFQTFIYDLAIQGNEVILATDKGLIIAGVLTIETKEFRHQPGNTGSIGAGAVYCILPEPGGNFWLGTKEGGLNYFDGSKGEFTRFTKEDGLCNNSIYCMVKDDSGRIWLGTGKGLSLFDPRTKTFKNFNKADGIINTEYNRYSALKLSNGEILMGGMNGIDRFNPSAFSSAKQNPRVEITNVEVLNKSIHPTDKLSLRHNENFITFEFALLDFTAPEENKFAYKLEGIDKDWETVEGQHIARYPNLDPGTYRFVVKGANSHGYWSEEPAVIEFTIATPWWQSWWFYLLVAITVTSLLYLFYQYRINQLRKMYQMRNAISQDLHDEVGATLTSISFLSEVVQKQGYGHQQAKEALNKIGEYSREMISEMNDIVWAINPSHDRFEAMADRMLNYASPLLATKNIQLRFNADDELQKIGLSSQQRKNLYLIFKEAVNNAVKYSACTWILVQVAKKGNSISLTIQDNGCGFVKKANGCENGNGNGLHNMCARAKAIKATITMDSSPGEGTCIKVLMPIT